MSSTMKKKAGALKQTTTQDTSSFVSCATNSETPTATSCNVLLQGPERRLLNPWMTQNLKSVHWRRVQMERHFTLVTRSQGHRQCGGALFFPTIWATWSGGKTLPSRVWLDSFRKRKRSGHAFFLVSSSLRLYLQRRAEQQENRATEAVLKDLKKV